MRKFCTLAAALTLSLTPVPTPERFVHPETMGVHNTPVPEDNSQRQEVLWLARAMLSESDRHDEQWLVGWVIRNRVESDLYPDTFEGVVLEPYQFSAFNPGYRHREHYVSLTEEDLVRDHYYTLRNAEAIYAGELPRPDRIGRKVFHFYSPVSMVPAYREPSWARGVAPVLVIGERFRFYADIAI